MQPTPNIHSKTNAANLSPAFAAIGICLVSMLLLFSPSQTTYAYPAEDLFFRRIYSENIRIEKGLSQNWIMSIYQDSDGFLWFGTWDGLNRFDAHSFTLYNKENGLSSETIRAIKQHGDLLWIGTENGLNSLNLVTGEVKNHYSADDSISLTNNWVNHIFVDHRDRLWICTAAGLSEYIYEKKEFSQVFSRDYGNPMRSNYFNVMAEDFNNDFWVATNYGLVHYELGTGILTRYFRKPDDPFSLPSNQINTLVVDEYGNIWVGTNRGLARFDPSSKQFVNYHLYDEIYPERRQPDISSLAWENGKGLWIGTNGDGLFLLDAETKHLEHHTHSPGRLYSLSDTRVQSIHIDKQGIIWVGTFNGLNKIDRNAPRFRLYRNDPAQPNSLRNNSVWCFTESNSGKVLIGTDEGITIFDQKETSFEFITHQPSNRQSLASNQVRSLYQDQKGNIWAGTRDRGLSIFNYTTGQFRHFGHNSSDTTSLSSNFIFHIKGQLNGKIWVATDNGLNLYMPQLNAFRRFVYNPDNKHSLPHNRIYSMFMDSGDHLWLSTANGLARYREETDDFETFRIPESVLRQNMVYTNQFFAANMDRHGILWVGTRGGGMVRYDPTTGEYEIFTQADGLSNNVVYGALIDNEGYLWITTNWGLSRFDPNDRSFVNYEVTDGLQSNEFNLNAALLADNGQLFIGGMNGFNTFDPAFIKTNKQPPPVRITAFKIFNQLQSGQIKDGDTIRLKYHNNFFSFEFTALDFTNPSKNKFRFKLENYDLDWIERSADKRFAEYANIKPGTYTFRVVAANSDGFWNNEGVRLTIDIKPPWFDTSLFRIAAALVTIILVYLLIRYRVRVINRRHEVEKKYLAFEKQMFELEQKALQLQMNPHFLFNSLNSIQSFVVNNDTDNAIRYLSKFSQLMRRILSNSRESSIPLRDEIQALTLYVEIEKLRFDEKFDFKIYVDPAIDDSFVEIPPMILQPYVENAIIHGLMHSPRKGHLNISITLDGETIRCVIEDDGIGRQKASEIRKASGIERKSRGMIITSERLEILNQYSKDHYTVTVTDLKDEKGNATGTRVEVNIIYKEL